MTYEIAFIEENYKYSSLDNISTDNFTPIKRVQSPTVPRKGEAIHFSALGVYIVKTVIYEVGVSDIRVVKVFLRKLLDTEGNPAPHSSPIDEIHFFLRLGMASLDQKVEELFARKERKPIIVFVAAALSLLFLCPAGCFFFVASYQYGPWAAVTSFILLGITLAILAHALFTDPLKLFR